MGKIDTKDLLTQGRALREEKVDVMSRQTANRDILRNLSSTGNLSEEEELELWGDGTDENPGMYPLRTRKLEDGEDSGNGGA